MGSNTSKTCTESAAVSQNNDLNKDDSSNPDPRSPTPEITRTPLQNKNGAKHNITKNVDLRKTFEDGKIDVKLIHNNPILSAVIKNHLQSYDPRSPTQDFERTPIVISNNTDEDTNKKLIKSENCESLTVYNDAEDNYKKYVSPDLIVPKNLYDQFIDLTLNDSLKESEEPLGSSTASKDVIENEISTEFSKPTKLLETNFDFVVTEPDKLDESNAIIESAGIELLEYEIKNVPLFKILPDDPRSPSTGIERTPIVVAKMEDADEGNVEAMSDDLLIKALQNTNSEPCENNGEDNDIDGIPIYEDQSNSLNETPKKSKSTNNSGSRTPLSCMKNKTDSARGRSKSSNTLYETKNKPKIQKKVSHIPRLKSLVKQPKYVHTGSSVSLKNIDKSSMISGDCENTPPHSHRDRWDKDSSIVL